MLSPLVDNCSGVKIATKAKNAKETTDNKPDSHLGKRLVRKYPIPVINIPRYIIDQAVIPIASASESDSALISELFVASATSPMVKPTTIISNPASMYVFL